MATFPRRRRPVIEESSDDSDGEGNLGQGTDSAEDSTKKKKKTAGKMFMTAVEIPIRPSGPTFSKNPPTTASRQLSMRNYFSSSPSSNLVVVPPKGKSTSKSSQKTSTLNTFVVRSPQKPPAPQPVSKPKSRARSLSNSSKMVIDLDGDKDDESDFAPPSEAPSDGEASVAESDDEIDPKEEESSEPELIFAGGSSSKSTKVTARKSLGGAYKHHSAPKNCNLSIKPREGDLPPISDLQLIFDDIVSRIPALTGLFGDRGGRKLRVATMCSGTESPLLALGLFGRSFQKMELGKLEIQHVFSCEIEPYKQAYIERNFKPPILFRDIRELGQDFATTAYGAKVAVPGNVDLLVAGTSCVDFSNLNNKKKTLDDVGESSDTFHGMMRWVNRHRPTIIIHENVAGAAWTEMRAEYLEAGYSAEFLTSFDTKNYYIPQTRCRGYLFAIDQKGSSIPNQWIDAMRKLRRPASCTLEAFLLQSDDPRIHQVRMDLAAKRDASNKPARSVEWEKCEGKHQKERIVQKLGLKRPMTHWEEGGISKMFDFAWQDWGHSQVDRVLDLMDINLLTQAKSGIDANYKEQFWNLSQNVDRNTFGKANGICPCLTPHMIPFLTFRGGPMIGLESLAMQGLPINELLLTRETSQELQNLAGNAMSSTVVGTAILAALILSQDHLRPVDDDDMDIDVEAVDISTRISGVGKLVERPLDLSTSQQLEIKILLKEAQRSARLCVCEGRSDITGNKILVCKECGHTSCEKCGGRPEHHYIPFKYTDNRITPLQFEHKVKSVLPMRLLVDGISSSLLDDLKSGNPDIAANIKNSDWKTFRDCLTYAVKAEFRFMSLKRQEIWSANYDAPEARIELLLDPLQPEWRLFAKCPVTDGALSFRRKMCEMPLARMRLAGASDPMEGQWEICLPARYKFNLEIEGKGSLVESWEASIGLQDPKFADKKVWDHIQISVPDDMKHCLDQNIDGTYKLLPTCGTANGSLHKKVDQDGALPIYFFLDPTKTSEAKSDPFVFSTTTRRYAYGEKRPLVARMETEFRPSSATGPRTFKCFADGQWVSTDEVTLVTPMGKKGMINEGVFSIPGPQGLSVSVSNDDCRTANAVLTCRVPLKNQAEEIWTEGVWTEIDRIHERNTFESLAWLTERIRSLEQLSKWNNLNLPSDYSNCERCAPTAPILKWVRKGNKYVPREDSEQAAPYERALKNRPSPFVTQLKLERSNDGNKVGLLRIGLNIPTLVHRALSRLPHAENATPMLSWRLTTDYIPVSKLVLPPFELTSNKRDAQFTQPPNFITKLRPEQLRSLTWMMEQEKDEAHPFVEEEVSEALLPHLNWKAEGRAERPVQVLGGVLADQVGYGKTAITLGLIDCSHTSIALPSKIPGMIPVKATLIVVPPHLTNQWPSEIAKFTGNTYKIIKLKSHSDLNKTSIQQIMDADIIVVSSTLFKSDAYLSNLATFSASNSPPGSDGRRFNAWQDQALIDLKEQVEGFRNGGADFVLARMEEQSKKMKNDEVGEVFVQTKRLIGKAYVEAKEKGKAGAKRKRPDTDQDSDSNGSSSSVSGRTKKSKVSVARTEGDPWKLKSSLVKRDWKQMMAPPLPMFHFNRLVIDEYTYLGGRIHSSITCLKSKFRWILSGTPPLDDFADVKTISVFLGVHLGIDDDMVGKIDNRKKIKKDRTDVEAFTAFRELRSPNWHQRRQEVAQAFLNQFVRQNIAEIDEIPFEEHAVPVSLPAAERAIYLELEHHLQALDMNIRRSKIKLDNDRDKRLQESLGDSASAEEALLKRCSHFVLDFTKEDEENAVQACQVIVKDRKRQLTSCREEVLQRLVDCLKRYKEIPKSSFPGEDHFNTWLTTTRTAGIGDAEAGKDILALIDQAYGNGKGPTPFTDIGNVPKVNFLSKSKKAAKGKKVDDDVIPWPTSMEDKIQQLRDRTSQLRALVRKELVGRHRSLRYFKIVRDLQQFGLAEFAKRNSISNVSCPGCGRSGLPVSEIAVLSSCGHQGCYTCLEAAAHRQECLTTGCDAPARVLNVVKGDSLGVEDPKEGLGKHYGMKLEKVMELIKETIPKKDKVLLFVQFPDLMEKVAEVLSEYKIDFLQLKGTAAAQSKALQRFQESGDRDSLKVLLLNVMDESASGANLTNANHAIFLSPLLTTSDYEYRSCETQAIGRVRRYGQQKKVHVWRFLTENTIDITIFEQRSGLKFKDYPQYKV